MLVIFLQYFLKICNISDILQFFCDISAISRAIWDIIRGRYPNENPSDIMFTTIDDINELNDINDISDIVHHWQKDIIEDLFEKLNYEIRNIHNIDYRWKWHMLSQILCHYSERDDLDLEYNAYYDKITQIIEVRSDVVKRKQLRKENIKFAVGMIVTHIRPSFYPFYEEDHHHGVIIGWHNEHNRTLICEMKEDHLYTCTDDKDENIVDQPYYLILSEDNRICYWQQDLISICTPKWINNVEIGRYFSKFEGTHYVPNKSLAENYPTDVAIIHEILFSQ